MEELHFEYRNTKITHKQDIIFLPVADSRPQACIKFLKVLLLLFNDLHNT